MKRLLLVDDDPLVLKIFRDGLARHSFHVETARDGIEAISMLRKRRPDLVILDLMMPKFSGVDVLKFIRGEASLAELPVVVLSNSYLNDMAAAAHAAGVQEALLKSRCTPSALVSVINQILEPDGVPQPADESLEAARHFPAHSVVSAVLPVTEEELRARACRDFLDKAEETCAALRHLFEAVAQSLDVVQSCRHLEAFYRKMHFVTASAGLTGCHRIGKMSSVLEALLFVLIDKPAQLNPSVLRTIEKGLELLKTLFKASDNPAQQPQLNPQILVVDDDPLSNRLEVLALRRAQFHAYGIEDPIAALERLQQSHYDLILLDVEMPRLDGFEFCRRARALTKYQRTPIIYVTSHADRQTRAEALLSGGTDVISKPIFPMELAVKAITHLLESELADR